MVELITHVDEHDNILGVRPKTDFIEDPSLYYRTSHLYIFNSKGELLIQQRSKTKRVYPGLYDTSVSGTVRAGETYEEAIARETYEELGIKDLSYNFVLKNTRTNDIHSNHETLYSATYDGSITCQEGEVEKTHWMSKSQIIQKMKDHPEKFCPPFLEEIRHIINDIRLTFIFI